MKSSINVLDSYAKAFRDLINAKIMSSPKTVRELLHLNKDRDWDFLCTAMDVVEDASAAIRNFLQFGLDGPTRYQDVGERYLRLYGLLSATYVQQRAVLKLVGLMNVPNLKAIRTQLDGLVICSLRHKLAAHSTNYRNAKTQTIETYVPVRIGVGGFHCTHQAMGPISHESTDLEAALEKHCRLLISVMDTTYEKAIQILYKDHDEKLTEFTEKLDDLRTERDGGIVLRMPQGGKLVIHSLVDRNLTPHSTGTRRKRRA